MMISYFLYNYYAKGQQGITSLRASSQFNLLPLILIFYVFDNLRWMIKSNKNLSLATKKNLKNKRILVSDSTVQMI